MRFFLDHDVDARVGKMLRAARHDAWTAGSAGMALDIDDQITVAAARRHAAVVTHDKEFTDRRLTNTVGWHVWLTCREKDAPKVLAQHLDEVVGYLERFPDVVVEVRVERVILHPPSWE